jgi:hypothetical protein
MSRCGHIIPLNLHAKTHVPGGLRSQCGGLVGEDREEETRALGIMQTGSDLLSSTYCAFPKLRVAKQL